MITMVSRRDRLVAGVVLFFVGVALVLIPVLWLGNKHRDATTRSLAERNSALVKALQGQSASQQEREDALRAILAAQGRLLVALGARPIAVPNVLLTTPKVTIVQEGSRSDGATPQPSRTHLPTAKPKPSSTGLLPPLPVPTPSVLSSLVPSLLLGSGGHEFSAMSAVQPRGHHMRARHRHRSSR